MDDVDVGSLAARRARLEALRAQRRARLALLADSDVADADRVDDNVDKPNALQPLSPPLWRREAVDALVRSIVRNSGSQIESVPLAPSDEPSPPSTTRPTYSKAIQVDLITQESTVNTTKDAIQHIDDIQPKVDNDVEEKDDDMVPMLDDAAETRLTEALDAAAAMVSQTNQSNIQTGLTAGIVGQPPLSDTARFCNSELENGPPRIVHTLNWSPIDDNLFVAAYRYPMHSSIANIATSPTSSANGQQNSSTLDGLAYVWDASGSTRTPAHTLQFYSSISTISFVQSSTSILVGGATNGSLCIWDVRASNLPVQTSTLQARSSAGCIAVHAHDAGSSRSLLSISQDGILDVWQMGIFSKPLESFQLMSTSISSTRSQTPLTSTHGSTHPRPITVSSAEFSSFDTQFIVGTNMGQLLLGDHDSSATNGKTKTSKGLTNFVLGDDDGSMPLLESHNGSVTSISSNRYSKNPNFSDMLLTTSIDWTVKVWRRGRFNAIFNGVSMDGIQNNSTNVTSPSTMAHKPEHSFRSSDYVTASCWCPMIGSRFAIGNCAGDVGLFDLSSDSDEAQCTRRVLSQAVTALSWSRNADWLAVGGLDTSAVMFVTT